MICYFYGGCTKMTVGEMIRRLREASGLTQKKLGEKCGLADSAIRRYESGGANPKIETLQKIGEALADYCDDWEILESMSQYAKENESIRILLNSIMNKIIEKVPEFKETIRNAELTISRRILDAHEELIKKYDSLNTQGQQKALDHIDMLTKIPEYQLEYVMDTVSKAFQDGHIRSIKKEDSDKKTED